MSTQSTVNAQNTVSVLQNGCVSAESPGHKERWESIRRRSTGHITEREIDKDMDRIQTVTVRNTVLGDGTPKICVPITAGNRKELEEQVQKIHAVPCDMAEWRADFFEESDDEEWLVQALEFLRGALGELPLLFTFRTKEEGGERSISLEESTSV